LPEVFRYTWSMPSVISRLISFFSVFPPLSYTVFPPPPHQRRRLTLLGVPKFLFAFPIFISTRPLIFIFSSFLCGRNLFDFFFPLDLIDVSAAKTDCQTDSFGFSFLLLAVLRSHFCERFFVIECIEPYHPPFLQLTAFSDSRRFARSNRATVWPDPLLCRKGTTPLNSGFSANAYFSPSVRDRPIPHRPNPPIKDAPFRDTP